MHRGFTLLLLLVVFLCFQTKALPFLEKNSLRRNILMNALAASSGIIDIKMDTFKTFYVDADLSSPSQSSSYSADTTRMMVSISNDETMMAENCFNFSSYNCSAPNCSKLPETGSIDFPFLTTNVQYAQSSLDLDDKYWSLNSATYLYLAQSCKAGPTSSSSLGSGLSGILGLGIGNGSKANFAHDAIFSIFINSGLTGGKLLFMKDTSAYAKSSSPSYTFPANSTWQIDTQGGSISFQDGGYAAALNGNVIFDINFDALGLPPGPFSVFMDFVIANSDVPASCNYSGPGKPLCFTRHDLEDFPDLIISVNGSHIKAPFGVYAMPINETGYFYLNVKQISPDLSSENYVSPSFANSMILGANFMSYYYTVFDASGSNPVIYLYTSINVPWRFPSWLWIPLAHAVLFLIICCCCCYCCCCPNKKKSFFKNGKTRKDFMAAALKTTPLVENEQNVNDMRSPEDSENTTNPFKYDDGGENNSYYQSRPIYQPYQPPQ